MDESNPLDGINFMYELCPNCNDMNFNECETTQLDGVFLVDEWNNWMNFWMIFQNELDFIHWLLSKIIVDPWNSSSIVDFIHQNHPYSIDEHPWNTIHGWMYGLSS